MLFNSIEFIFFFLPVVWIVYFLLNRARLLVLAKAWLALSSLFFYGYWNIHYVPLIVTSMLINYGFGYLLNTWTSPAKRKSVLIVALLFNIGVLGFYKYADFFITNVNMAFGTSYVLLHIVLPLAISFYTFHQIIYIVDTYRNEKVVKRFSDYMLYVLFFPQLIAGPLATQQEMIPQFNRLRLKVIHYPNIALGVLIFSIGLFKKVMIADTFATWVNAGFSQSANLSLFEGWITLISFNFQLYFDFSGYVDMAMGVALLFNIRLPINFKSPYKATNIAEFWQRWHITLLRFLNKYVFTLWLNATKGKKSTLYLKVIVVFLLSGLWHGAAWTFVFLGFMHGVALVMHRLWRRSRFRMPAVLGWICLTYFLIISHVFFRASSWDEAWHLLAALHGFHGVSLPPLDLTPYWQSIAHGLHIANQPYFISIDDTWQAILYILCAFAIVLLFRNTSEWQQTFKPNFLTLAFAVILLCVSIVHLTHVKSFLYFNF